MAYEIKPPLQGLANPWEGRHDLKRTRETISKLLAGGTPNWVKWPKDYRAMAQEALLADKEVSAKMAYRYKMEDQELLLNEVARKVNPIGTRVFIAKLRQNRVASYPLENG